MCECDSAFLDHFDIDRLHGHRLERTYDAMKRLNLDAIVATTFDNVRYIADCRPYFSAAYYVNTYVAVVRPGELPLVQGPVVEGAPMGLARPIEGWKGYPMIPVPIIAKKWSSMISTMLESVGVKSGRIGFDDMSFIPFQQISSTFPRIEVVPAYEAMLDVRAIKSPDEVALLRRAAEIVDIGAQAGFCSVKEGVREREVVARMAAAMYEAGSEAEPWATSLSSGDRALTSVFASDRILQDGDLAVFDLGSIYEGYLGDTARTCGVGTVSHEAKGVYTGAYNALVAGTKAVRPGTMASEVDEKIRQALVDADCNVPSLSSGHGIGVGAPEVPWVTPKENGIHDYELKPGMVLCLEPFTSKDNVAAAGCEDTILVTESGREVMNKSSKQEHLLVR